MVREWNLKDKILRTQDIQQTSPIVFVVAVAVQATVQRLRQPLPASCRRRRRHRRRIQLALT
jgi:hypothetical protein